MKPILFSTEMVKAILDGRKTMTRRVIKPQPVDEAMPKPKYEVGDILWVRETWRPTGVISVPYAYKTDEDPLFLAGESGNVLSVRYRYKPSIHMPKEAARLFLRVTDVRVELLHEILCGDMEKEGVIPTTVTGGHWQQWQREYFRPLWDSLNAKRGYGWDTNPLVWVIEFERGRHK